MPNQYEISPAKLWSPLQRQLAMCGLAKASPQQWRGTIRNLQTKGVSAVEIEWSGVLEWLGEMPDSGKVLATCNEVAHCGVVQLADLLDFLAENPPCDLVLQRQVSNDYVPRVRYEEQPYPTNPPVTVENGVRVIKTLGFRDRIFGIHVWLHIEVDTSLFGHHCYWSLSVPRGRRKISPSPVEREFATSREALAYGRTLIERMARRLANEGFVGQIQALNHYTGYALPGGDRYTEWLITAPNLPDEYWGVHFDLPNIVAHVRTTVRTSPQGMRLLLMEEIQSDWNQALRKAIQQSQQMPTPNDEAHTNGDPPPDNPYLNHWLDASLRFMALLATRHNLDGLAWLPGPLHAERFPWANAEGLVAFYDRIVPAAVGRFAKAWGLGLDSTQFETLSRQYLVRQLRDGSGWYVENIGTGQRVGVEHPDFVAAEAARRALEVPVLETVPALFLSPDMRADILAQGLPVLGTISKRVQNA